MHLSTFHSHYSVAPAPNTLVPRAELGHTSYDWVWYLVGVVGVVGFVVAIICYAHCCAARQKWKHARRAKKQQHQHQQWHGQEIALAI
jgi:H+/gluconate symporter-like permease